MQRILVVQQVLDQSGGGAIAQKCVIDALRELGREVFTMSFSGDSPADFPENHIAIQQEFTSSKYRKYWYDRSLVSAISQRIDQIKPDLVMVGQIWNFASLFLAVGRKIPILQIVHTAEYDCLNSMLTHADTMKACQGGIGFKCGAHKCASWRAVIQKRLLSFVRTILMRRYVAGFICHSDFMVRFVQRRTSARVHYVPLNVTANSEPRQKPPDQIQGRQVNLLFVGSLSWNKGVVELIKAMRVLAREPVNYHLTLIGDGDLKATIKEIIQAEGLEGRILLAGRVGRDLIFNYYADADIVVFPSYFESCGLVALEAMKLNKPLIVSNRGALPETVSEYDLATILPEIKPDLIAKAVVGVGKEIVGNNGRVDGSGNVGQAKFAPRHTAGRLEEILQFYLDKNPSWSKAATEN